MKRKVRPPTCMLTRGNELLTLSYYLPDFIDNEKYLKTLEKFLEPLYNSQPLQIIDTLPALMNSIKMIHTIARYYNTRSV